MAENEQHTDNTTFGKQKRRRQTVRRIMDILFISVCILFFIAALQTRYLSWIGIGVVTYLIMLTVAPYAYNLTVNKRMEKRFSRLMAGTMLMVCVAGVAVLLWPERDGSWRPYRFNDELAALEAQRAVPDKDNAALYYESLFAITDFNDRPRSFLRKHGFVRDEFTKYPWRSIDHQEVSQWLDSHAETLDKMLLIGKMEACRWPIQADVSDDFTVPSKKLRYCAELLIAAGNRDLAEGRLDEALAKYSCLLSMADHLSQQTDTISFCISVACEDMAMRMIKYALVESDLSDAQIERIFDCLPATADTWSRDGRMLLSVEKLRYMNLLAQVYEINDEGKIRFASGYGLSSENTDTPEPRRRTDKLWRIVHVMNMPFNPKAVRGMADGFFTRFDYLFNPNYVPQIGDYPEPSFWSPGSLSKVVCNPLRWGIETMAFDGESYVRLCHLSKKRIIERQGIWLVLGLRRYKNSHGEWPRSIDQASGYVSTETLIDSTNGEGFVYALDGDGFRLYSKGLNGIDEGGRDGDPSDSNGSGDDITIWPLRSVESGDEEKAGMTKVPTE